MDCFDADELWTAEGHSNAVMHDFRRICIGSIPMQCTLIGVAAIHL